MSWNIFIILALHEYFSSTHLIRNGYSTAITHMLTGALNSGVTNDQLEGTAGGEGCGTKILVRKGPPAVEMLWVRWSIANVASTNQR